MRLIIRYQIIKLPFPVELLSKFFFFVSKAFTVYCTVSLFKFIQICREDKEFIDGFTRSKDYVLCVLLQNKTNLSPNTQYFIHSL